jgi:tetratricopeptide (TPR) repeat protein
MKRIFPSVLLVLFCGSVAFGQVSEGVKEALKAGGQQEKQGRLEEAVQVYQTALQTEANEELYKKAGSLLGKLQRYDDADTLLTSGIAKIPASTSLKNLLGFIKFKKNDVSGAKALWNEVLAVDAKNSFAREWIAKADGGSSATSVTSATQTTTSSAGQNETATSEGYAPEPVGAIEQQEELASRLYSEMAQTDDKELDLFMSSHRQVIKKCPQTAKAEESCWRLSNLFMTARDEPEFEKAAELLEHLLKAYPQSEVVPHAKTRLLSCYKGLKNHEKVAKMFEEMFQNKDQMPDDLYVAYALQYGETLMALGRGPEAKSLFEDIVKKNVPESLETQAAQNYLENL